MRRLMFALIALMALFSLFRAFAVYNENKISPNMDQMAESTETAVS